MGGQLPEGWEWKKLNDLAQFIYGYPFESSKFNNEGRGTPLIRIRNLIKDKTDTFFDGEFEESYLVQNGDILIGMDGEFNIVRWGGEGALLNQRICKLESTSATLIPSYAFRVLKKILKRIEDKTPHVTVKHLSAKQLNSIQIPFPPLETQRKIVAILEKSEETKKLRMQADELTSQLLQSVFLEMFGDSVINNKNWELKTIEELSSEIVDCPHSTPKYVDYVTDFPCIRTTELKEGYIDWKVMKYLDEDEYKKRVNRLSPIEGDVIYGREGSFGEAVRVPANTNMSLGQRVMLFRPKPKVCNSVFLWALIRSDSIYFQALKKTSGSTVRHVNIKDIKKFKGICPPIELQNKFAQIAKKVEVMRQKQKQSQEYIDDLFNALTQKAFKGELIA